MDTRPIARLLALPVLLAAITACGAAPGPASEAGSNPASDPASAPPSNAPAVAIAPAAPAAPDAGAEAAAAIGTASPHCLVGAWQPQGNAMANWISRKNPGMAMQFQQEAASLVFEADGRYRADMRGAATASGPGGMAAHMGGQFGGGGRWSVADGQLVLAQDSDRSDAALELVTPDGQAVRAPVPTGPAGPMRMGYACEGDRFETRMAIPGTGETVVQPYLRQRG